MKSSCPKPSRSLKKNAFRRLWGKEITVREHPLKWEMNSHRCQLIGGYVPALSENREWRLAKGNAGCHIAGLSECPHWPWLAVASIRYPSMTISRPSDKSS